MLYITFKLRFNLYRISINYLQPLFFMIFFVHIRTIFFFSFCFPSIIMYILNIDKAIKKMTIINEWDLLKRQLLFNETSEKETSAIACK